MLNDEPKPTEEHETRAIEIDPTILLENTKLLLDAVDEWRQNPAGVNRPGSASNSFAFLADGSMSTDKTLLEKDDLASVHFDFLPQNALVANRPLINEATIFFSPDVRATERMRLSARITVRSYNTYNSRKLDEQVVDESTSPE
jgi:hypothetical protein